VRPENLTRAALFNLSQSPSDNALNPITTKNLPYDALKNFAPIFDDRSQHIVADRARQQARDGTGADCQRSVDDGLLWERPMLADDGKQQEINPDHPLTGTNFNDFNVPHQTTNLGVRSSNLFGRAKFPPCGTKLRTRISAGAVRSASVFAGRNDLSCDLQQQATERPLWR